ncbi:MAG: 3-isopropylmalate dehydratase large subunit [Planctomycetota bacterium]
MSQTIAEKILSDHVGRPVKPGELVTLPVDLAFVQDGTGPLAVRQIEAMGLDSVTNPERVIVFLDHAAPSPRKELSNDHVTLRQFCAKTGARLSDVGDGVCHVIVNESYSRPGDVIVGADSHSCTAGAVGAFATGMGSTDIGVAMALGKTWMMVPKTYRVRLDGSFKPGSMAKDFMLKFIGDISAEGANYRALEFTGPAVDTMPMCERLSISNMAVECGAKAGIFPSDDITRQYLERMGRGGDYTPLAGDPDAEVEKSFEYDLGDIEPQIACPHFVDNVKPVCEMEPIHVDQVAIGTCTNGRIEDFRLVAKMMKGKKVAEGTRLIVTPGSRAILTEGMADGTFATLVEAGAAMNMPGCGSCVGVHAGILADDEVCVATQNRNFQGRMGNPNAGIYLTSPLTAAACALTGKVTDPREFM